MSSNESRRDAIAAQDILVTKEAARLMRMSHRTLEDWRLTGDGPPYLKVGRRVLYRLADLLEFLDGAVRRNTGGPDPAIA